MKRRERFTSAKLFLLILAFSCCSFALKANQAQAVTRADIISVATAELGYKEKASNSQLDSKEANAGSANYTKYERDLGVPNGQAWCAFFLWWCYQEAGVPTDAYPKSGAVYTCAQWHMSNGTWHYRNSGYVPKAGDSIVLGSLTTHIGMVEYVDSVNKKVCTIEGNSSGMVTRRSYDLSSTHVVGYCTIDLEDGDLSSTASSTAVEATPTATPDPANPGWPYEIPTKTLKKGSVGEDVKWVQYFMNSCFSDALSVDGDFGKITAASVKVFKKAYGFNSANATVGTKVSGKMLEVWNYFKENGKVPNVTSTSSDDSDSNTKTANESLTNKKSDYLSSKLKNMAYSKTPYGQHGSLKVWGNKVVDRNGMAFQLKGVSSYGINWEAGSNYVSDAVVHELRDKWGANCFRIAMYTENENGYCATDVASQKRMLKTIDKGVKAAKKYGMYVIIDWHTLSDGSPLKHVNDALGFFNTVSRKYAKYGNVIYEICNEPNNDSSWAQVKKYANRVIPVIRNNNKDALVICGTPEWCQDVDIVARSPLKYGNVVYSVHFFAATHGNYHRNKVKVAYKKKLPMICSQCSACESSGNGKLDKDSANKWMKLLNKCGIGYCVWSLSNGADTPSLLNSSCTKITDFEASDLSSMGLWTVEQLSK
ncbi:MAG: cellulase family glycosylhydrolase [Lachnospiraceae bacterium]|nr:cellulase family glycosylhydrolase [Lachnospiraceae bacterium]